MVGDPFAIDEPRLSFRFLGVDSRSGRKFQGSGYSERNEEENGAKPRFHLSAMAGHDATSLGSKRSFRHETMDAKR